MHGKISEFSSAFGSLRYTPRQGFVGTDIFTFKLQLGNLNSNLATVAITVDDDLTNARRITEQRKQGVNVLNARRRSSLLGSIHGLGRGSIVKKYANERLNNTENPLSSDLNQSSMELTCITKKERSRLSKTHQVNESVNI